MSIEHCDIHGHYDTDVHVEGCPKCVYDDLLPVSLHTAQSGHRFLLDRHNDVLATFDQSVEQADCERLVELINKGV